MCDHLFRGFRVASSRVYPIEVQSIARAWRENVGGTPLLFRSFHPERLRRVGREVAQEFRSALTSGLGQAATSCQREVAREIGSSLHSGVGAPGGEEATRLCGNEARDRLTDKL